MPSRAEVYAAIDGERDYQDQRWEAGLRDRFDEDKDVAEWLCYIRFHIRKMEDCIYMLDRGAALQHVRKIAALAVRCMEVNGAPPRAKPSADDGAEMPAKAPEENASAAIEETPKNYVETSCGLASDTDEIKMLVSIGCEAYMAPGPEDPLDRARYAIAMAGLVKDFFRAFSKLLSLLADARSATKLRPADYLAEVRKRVDVYLGRKTKEPVPTPTAKPATEAEVTPEDAPIELGPEHNCDESCYHQIGSASLACAVCIYDLKTGYSEWKAKE